MFNPVRYIGNGAIMDKIMEAHRHHLTDPETFAMLGIPDLQAKARYRPQQRQHQESNRAAINASSAMFKKPIMATPVPAQQKNQNRSMTRQECAEVMNDLAVEIYGKCILSQVNGLILKENNGKPHNRAEAPAIFNRLALDFYSKKS